MVFYCISEAEYEISNWYKHIISGLLKLKRSKRFTVILVGDVNEIEKFSVNSDDVLLVIGSGYKWLEYVVNICESMFGNRIIVLGNSERIYERKYSIVTFDVARDARQLFNYLKFYKKDRIAVYGINPHSASDGFRKRAFIQSGVCEDDVYINNGNLKQCFEHFKSKNISYDGVICANDYCAISFVKNIKQNNMPLPFVVSCDETMLAREFSPSITNLTRTYSLFADAGTKLARMLNKNSEINSIECYLSSEIVAGETTGFLPVSQVHEPEFVVNSNNDDNFYADTEVDEMIKIEKLLNMCDGCDRKLLQLVIKGVSYSEIAGILYMSENGVKYKLKAMYDICGVNSKSEFLKLVTKYINKV